MRQIKILLLLVGLYISSTGFSTDISGEADRLMEELNASTKRHRETEEMFALGPPSRRNVAPPPRPRPRRAQVWTSRRRKIMSRCDKKKWKDNSGIFKVSSFKIRDRENSGNFKALEFKMTDTKNVEARQRCDEEKKNPRNAKVNAEEKTKKQRDVNSTVGHTSVSDGEDSLKVLVQKIHDLLRPLNDKEKAFYIERIRRALETQGRNVSAPFFPEGTKPGAFKLSQKPNLPPPVLKGTGKLFHKGLLAPNKTTFIMKVLSILHLEKGESLADYTLRVENLMKKVHKQI